MAPQKDKEEPSSDRKRGGRRQKQWPADMEPDSKDKWIAKGAAKAKPPATPNVCLGSLDGLLFVPTTMVRLCYRISAVPLGLLGRRDKWFAPTIARRHEVVARKPG